MARPENYDKLPMYWVGDFAGRRAKLAPRRTAVFDATSGIRLRYADVDDRARRVATYLADELGLKKGDRVCFLSQNRVEAIDLFMAAGKLGVILAPLSFRLKKRELDDLLGRIEPQALFYEDAFAELADSLDMPDSVRARVELADGPCGYRDQVLATPARDVNVPLALDDTALYIHTGGTTATPKVCIISHRQMVWNSVEIMLGAADSLTDRRELLTFPLFHVGGWNTFLPVFHSGGYAVLMRKFEPEAALGIIESEGINHMGAVEPMLKFMAEHPSFATADLSSLRGIMTGGAPCAAATMEPFWQRGIPVAQSYGLTEAGPSNFVHAAWDSSMDELKAHSDSIGTSFFHCDYQIVDQDTLEPVSRGREGVLLMRSPHNFDGYLGQPERTAQAFVKDGWIYSGDLARETEEGYVYIVGRADNMFVSGGENVSPEEIENVLVAHDGVRQAAVIGVKDETWGQAPVAVVVPADPGAPPTETELGRHCKAQLAGFKIPKRFDFTDALPLTGAGKLDRSALKKRYT